MPGFVSFPHNLAMFDDDDLTSTEVSILSPEDNPVDINLERSIAEPPRFHRSPEFTDALKTLKEGVTVATNQDSRIFQEVHLSSACVGMIENDKLKRLHSRLDLSNFIVRLYKIWSASFNAKVSATSCCLV